MHSLNTVKLITILLSVLSLGHAKAQNFPIDQYNITWTSQSKNSSESMPVGGGDIGMNVWVENDDIYFYFSRSGTFDENNALLKLGRCKLTLSPNPFKNGDFNQTLNLKDGNLIITGKNKKASAKITFWTGISKPTIFIDIESNKAMASSISYESWRYQDRKIEGRANNANSYKWRGKNVYTKKDEIDFLDNRVLFYHHNEDSTIFDVTVAQQKMDAVKDQMTDPLRNLTFGGLLHGEQLKMGSTYTGKYLDTDFKGWELISTPQTNQTIQIDLYTKQTEDIESWKTVLLAQCKTETNLNQLRNAVASWWNNYWNKSYIYIDSPIDSVWQTGRNYQLFRYMLGCNAYGSSPTKFNGGLFTYDPSQVDEIYVFTPDHRNWGGGTHTAQNQRLVYFPMLRSGDFNMMKPQFDYYLKILKNASLRSKHYWQHEGACFTEQLENFGLPNYAEYSSKRPEGYDPGMQYNAWLEYQWDTVLEFCLMILESETYDSANISSYIPLIEESLTFFDEHYQYLAKKRGRKGLDGEGKLVLYPGSSCETYKMAYNATSTVAALQVVTKRLLASEYLSPDRIEHWQEFAERIPELSYRQVEGKTMIAPAKLWERINNTEAPQLYPVYPWSIYGLGKPGLDTAKNTYFFDPDVQKFKSHVGWKQYNIFAARLGLTEEAAKITTAKLMDSGRRFPAFWGPGYDWVPDHNWGGSGAIGLQEMLLQTDGNEIRIFPAWPKEWDVSFKLYAPQQTVVEATLKNGEIINLKTTPSEREKDIILPNSFKQ